MKKLLSLFAILSIVPLSTSAMHFDGVGDYLETSKSTPFQFANTTFSVTFWCKTNIATGNQGVIVGQLSSAGTGGWDIRFASGQVNVLVKASDTSNAALRLVSVLTNNNVWHFYTAIIHTDTVTVANNNITLYMDGLINQQALSLGANPYATSPNTMKIGSSHAASRYLPGEIEDVRVYNRALGQNELRQIMYGSPLPSGLVARWRLLAKASGLWEPDISGFQANATSTATMLNGPLSPLQKFRR